MKKTIFLFFVLAGLAVCPGSTLNAQGGVGINTAGVPPDSSALFDVNSTNKGELMPRLTTAQRNGIAKPANGLFIYNTDCNVINFNAGTSSAPNWVTVNSSNALIAGVAIAASPVGAICAGTAVTFTATPASGINSPAYQWQVNGNNVGTNSSSYASTGLNNGDVVNCVLSSEAPCVTNSPATSNGITMLVNAIPGITGTTPASFCSGSAVTLGASATSGVINWYADSTGGSSLSTGASFTISGLISNATYYVDATANGCISAGRTPVTATFYASPPAQPGPITGPTSLTRDSATTYTINTVPNATNYVWTVALGNITSGQGSTSIAVTWGDSSGFGSVSVVTSNVCGTSPPRTIADTVAIQTFIANGTLRTGSLQTFTVPAGVTSIIIDAYGAQGGSGNGGYGSSAEGCNCSLPGGKGAHIKGAFNVTPGNILTILVGQAGGGYGGPYGNENGGGGGTFIVNQTTNTLLIAAGGGGGGPSDSATGYDLDCSRLPTDGDGQAGNAGVTPSCTACGCGTGVGGTGGAGGSTTGDHEGGAGGGYTGNGENGGTHCTVAYGGLSFTNGATGGFGNTCYDVTGTNNGGGYGGGGGGMLSGPGAGGGYSGGGTIGSWTSYSTWGGGGGSYNAGSNQTNTSGVQIGPGSVAITW